MNNKSLKEKIVNIISNNCSRPGFDEYTRSADQILALLVEKLEGMKKEPTISFEGGSPEYHIEYNQALTDLLERMEAW